MLNPDFPIACCCAQGLIETRVPLRRRQCAVPPDELMATVLSTVVPPVTGTETLNEPSAAAVVVALVCLPCSANLARAVSIRRRWILAAADFPRLGFDAAQVPAIQLDVRDALDRACRFLGEDSAEYRALTEQLRVLPEPYERN